jgi:hypothetical protein
MDGWHADASPVDDLRRREARIRHALGRDPRLTALDHRVAERMIGYLHWHSDSRIGLMWPSAERLAEEVGAETRSVRRSLRRLLDFGYLDVAAAGGGRRQTTRYRLGTIDLGNSDRLRLKTVTGGAGNSDRLRPKTVTGRSPDNKEENQEERVTRAPAQMVGFQLEADAGLAPNPSLSVMLDDWQPGSDMAAWAAEHVPSVTDPISLDRFAHFKDWHRAHGKTHSDDWNATYRVWLRRQVEIDRRQGSLFLPIDGSAQTRQSDAEVVHTAHLAAFEKNGTWFSHWGPRPDAEGVVA